MKKLIRITTVPISLKVLLKGQLKFLREHYKIIAVSSPGKELSEAEKFEGVETRAIRMTRSITPFADIGSLSKLLKLLRLEKPDIVHTHTPKAGTVGMMASKIAGVKHRIHTVAGLPLLESKGAKRKLLNVVEKLTYKCATKVLVNSEVLRQIIIKQGLADEEKLQVLGKGSSNGVNIDYFNLEAIEQSKIESLRTSLKINESAFIFIYMGRLVSDKGINEMVEAFNTLSNTNSNVKLLMLGHREDKLNPLHKKTEETIASNHNIIQTGFVNDVRPYLALSKVLVLASYREGFPNVVLQAGAMGRPCIVSDINGCNEIISHDYNGLVVPPKDSGAIYKAMSEIYKNDAKRENMGENARHNIEKNYSQDYVWSEILNFYNSLD